MVNRNLILTLAKVIIAAAWADGEITTEEINNLKLLFLRMRSSGFERGIQLTGQEWARLEMYMETPIDEAERARLVVELQNSLRTNADKQLAIEALRDVVTADDKITPAERELLEEVETAINEVSVGVTGAMERLVGNRVRERRDSVKDAPNRERFFNDFLNNKVYYSLTHHIRHENDLLKLPEEEMRKLGLAGGLMAKIAHIDGELSDDEFEAMVQTIQSHWSLDDEAASFVVDVALAAVDETYDIDRIMRELATAASNSERRQFLTALFAVAAADGEISMNEHEEIRVISRGLKLTHQDFINAKLQVIRQE